MASQMSMLGAEVVHIDGQEVSAVLGESQNERMLMGGSRAERDLDGQFPTDSTIKLRVGQAVKARNKKWKIQSFRRGKAMTTFTIIEPNRIEQD